MRSAEGRPNHFRQSPLPSMPRRNILVIGSGPIVIGQAAEFDYAGVQACRALREEGHRVVLVNSNPATIMTDPEIADAVYLEPLTVASVEAIIARERPDALLADAGRPDRIEPRRRTRRSRRSRTLRRRIARHAGRYDQTCRRPRALQEQDARDRRAGSAESVIVTEVEQGVAFAAQSGYPLVVRPAYTLGGTGGGVVYNEAELRERLDAGLECLADPSGAARDLAAGLERDRVRSPARRRRQLHHRLQHGEHRSGRRAHRRLDRRRAVADALAISITRCCAAPRINVIRALNVQGGCNIQFALHPDRSEYAIIEVNPRVSRSSALASKATGYPIAKISTRIALGSDARRDSQSRHRRDQSGLRTDARLLRGQDSALAVRQVSAGRYAARHADEVDRRGDGDRPHVSSPH